MNRLFNISFVAVILILTGCENEETLSLKGDIVGFVNIIDEFGDELEDNSGIEVKVENTSYLAITNEIGKYEIKGVPAGTYSISYTADSCGMDKYSTFQHVGGSIAAYIDKFSLYKLPTYEPDTIILSYSNDYIHATVWLNYPPKEYCARFYFSNSPDVSIDNYTYSLLIDMDGNSTLSGRGFELSYTDLDPLLPIYYVVYQFNYYGRNAGYYDYETEKTVYTSCRKVSDVRELIVD